MPGFEAHRGVSIRARPQGEQLPERLRVAPLRVRRNWFVGLHPDPIDHSNPDVKDEGPSGGGRRRTTTAHKVGVQKARSVGRLWDHNNCSTLPCGSLRCRGTGRLAVQVWVGGCSGAWCASNQERRRGEGTVLPRVMCVCVSTDMLCLAQPLPACNFQYGGSSGFKPPAASDRETQTRAHLRHMCNASMS